MPNNKSQKKNTLLKYMQTHNNKCVDILWDYRVDCLPNNTDQVSAHSVLCMHWCLFRWLRWL